MIFGIGFLDRWTNIPRHFVPAAVTMAMLILQLLPWTWSGEAITPSLVLMSLFFWSIRAPRLSPPVLAFVVGAMADLSELTPFGSQAIIFLLLTMRLRRKPPMRNPSFFQLWALFSAVCLGVNLLLWLIEIAVGGRLMPAGQVIARSAIAIAVFPFMTRFILMPALRLAGEDGDG